MGVPLTSGSLRTKISDMQIGDYIVCNYQATSGAVGTFSNFGGTAGTEIPLTASLSTPNGSFYFVKADKGLLIADRAIQTNITWDTLNTGKVIQGLSWNLIPKMTSNTAPSGNASASSIYSATFDAWKAFNGTTVDANDAWSTVSGTITGWLAYDFVTPKTIRQYNITSRNGGIANEAPKTWTFEGSNDNSTWNVLDNRTNETGWSLNEKRTYVFSNNNSFRYYRINITANNGSTGDTSIGELQMSNAVGGIIRSLTGGIAFADANGNSSATDKSFGAFPTNNQWDRYIVNSTLNGNITKGDDNVWHWIVTRTWTQETISYGINPNTYRIARGYSGGKVNSVTSQISTTNDGVSCFRPAFEYLE